MRPDTVRAHPMQPWTPLSSLMLMLLVLPLVIGHKAALLVCGAGFWIAAPWTQWSKTGLEKDSLWGGSLWTARTSQWIAWVQGAPWRKNWSWPSKKSLYLVLGQSCLQPKIWAWAACLYGAIRLINPPYLGRPLSSTAIFLVSTAVVFLRRRPLKDDQAASGPEALAASTPAGQDQSSLRQRALLVLCHPQLWMLASWLGLAIVSIKSLMGYGVPSMLSIKNSLLVLHPLILTTLVIHAAHHRACWPNLTPKENQRGLGWMDLTSAWLRSLWPKLSFWRLSFGGLSFGELSFWGLPICGLVIALAVQARTTVPGLVVGLALIPLGRKYPRLVAGLLASAIIGILGAPVIAKIMPIHTWLGLQSCQERFHAWRLAEDFWASSPWFGLGPAGLMAHMRSSWFSYIFKDVTHRVFVVHPHNLGLELLGSWGIVGTTLMVGLGFSGLYQSTRRPASWTTSLTYALFGYGLVVTSFYASVFQDDWFVAWMAVTPLVGTLVLKRVASNRLQSP
jgi:hypothetical protein